MGWEEGRDFRPGDPGGLAHGSGGAARLNAAAGFAHGGRWDVALPSAALAAALEAAALEAAAGVDGSRDGADLDARVGMARQWGAIESWAAAQQLATLRVMIRENADGHPLPRRRSDLPEGWDDSLNYEVAAALAMGPVSAGNLAALAWALGTRLPGTGRLLATGILSRSKAKLIAAVFEPLSDEESARAESLILGEVAGKTYYQVERLAWRAALAVAPDAAERRRRAAERDQARVTVFREESGAVGLSGRDLPAAQALSGHARVVTRAAEYAASGAFTGRGERALQALAYLHLLNGVSAADAIAFARTPGPPDDPAGGDGPGASGGPVGTPGDNRDSPGGAGPHDGSPAESCTGAGPGDATHGDVEPGGASPGGASPENVDPTSSAPASPDSASPDPGTPDIGDADRGRGSPADCPGGGAGHGADGGGISPRLGCSTGSARRAALAEVTVPLATLLSLAARPGENRLLGPLDSAAARSLAAAAARSPASHWEVTVIDARGHAIGHGTARPLLPGRDGRPPPGGLAGAFPALVNITVTEALLRDLAAAGHSGAASTGAVPAGTAFAGVPPGGWQLTPRKAGDGGGAWLLTLPGDRQLTVRFDAVPTDECDHQYQVAGYLPGDRLRRLVRIRDQECTFPTCSCPAHQCDFEHAVPYDQGGMTCACNAGARSRRCHQVKQSPGWGVTQPQPGWHQWTTPTGRCYVQEPWRYVA